MTFQQHLAIARHRLAQAGIDEDEAALDAELLARHVTGWDRHQLLVAHAQEAPPGFATELDVLLKRRERREPASYILGHREFWNLDFEVSPHVLIPRPETELLVEQALACYRETLAKNSARRQATFVDVGTGSGCVAVALAHEIPEAVVIATDTSSEALNVARKNARRHGLEWRIRFEQTADLPSLPEGFTIVVSNPPYVPLADLETLPPEVRDFEPRSALAGGADGLDVIRALLRQADGRLGEAFVLLEFGFGQEADLKRVVQNLTRLRPVTMAYDLQGIPRVMVLRRT